MPEYQLIEKSENIAKRDFFDFRSSRSGLTLQQLGTDPNLLEFDLRLLKNYYFYVVKKLLIIAFWMLALIVCQGQEATNIIKYETVNGKMYGIDIRGNFHQMPNFGKSYYGKDPIPKKLNPSALQELLEDGGITEQELENDTIALHLPILKSNNHLQISGDLFITGSVLVLLGSALIIPGIRKGSPGLVYGGLAVIDVGILVYLGAGISMRKFKASPQKL